MGERTPLWLPLGDEWFCAGDRGVIHAARVDQALARQRKPRSRRRRTYDTVCGRQRVKAYAVEAVSDTGDPLGYSLMAWPPPARFAGDERCRGCWVETGRPRPNPSFRDLRRTAA